MIDDYKVIRGGIIAILILVFGMGIYNIAFEEALKSDVEGEWEEKPSPTSVFIIAIIAFIIIVGITLVRYLGIL